MLNRNKFRINNANKSIISTKDNCDYKEQGSFAQSKAIKNLIRKLLPYQRGTPGNHHQ